MMREGQNTAVHRVPIELAYRGVWDNVASSDWDEVGVAGSEHLPGCFSWMQL